MPKQLDPLFRDIVFLHIRFYKSLIVSYQFKVFQFSDHFYDFARMTSNHIEWHFVNMFEREPGNWDEYMKSRLIGNFHGKNIMKPSAHVF